MSDKKIDLRLRQMVDNIEHLEEEKKELSSQVAEIYREAAALGFEPKIIRKVIGIRRRNIDDLKEEEDLVEMYKSYLGML
ncbi:MAG: DUF2312 domain-containing protein [Rickettsiales bacterium]|jgi:uncharacterized protein (UPF0335 family)|nr:DUF2312 domain-containing protein [Rickettsiales bacterium]